MADVNDESPRSDTRGQVGIGTLIVFIAMVLVAAIAAGVLINTAGFLQTKSEETGQQSGQQVTNRMQVDSVVGTHLKPKPASEHKYVGVVNVTVKKSPGATNIDLENATIQWIGPSGTYNLIATTVESKSAAIDGRFNITSFKDADDSKPVLNAPDDRMILTLDVGEDDTGYSTVGWTDENGDLVSGDVEFAGVDTQLEEGESVTLQITTKSGATTTESFTVPSTLSGVNSTSL